MMGSLEPDRRRFKSLFRCTATGRRAFSTTLASVGMYDASVGSTEAPNRVLDASVSSDRRAQRSARFAGPGKDLNPFSTALDGGCHGAFFASSRAAVTSWSMAESNASSPGKSAHLWRMIPRWSRM
jgi:hypothetical protein